MIKNVLNLFQLIEVRKRSCFKVKCVLKKILSVKVNNYYKKVLKKLK